MVKYEPKIAENIQKSSKTGWSKQHHLCNESKKHSQKQHDLKLDLNIRELSTNIFTQSFTVKIFSLTVTITLMSLFQLLKGIVDFDWVSQMVTHMYLYDCHFRNSIEINNAFYKMEQWHQSYGNSEWEYLYSETLSENVCW